MLPHMWEGLEGSLCPLYRQGLRNTEKTENLVGPYSAVAHVETGSRPPVLIASICVVHFRVYLGSLLGVVCLEWEYSWAAAVSLNLWASKE